jgi:hypothetical protein
MIFILHNNRYIAEDYIIYSLALEECRSEQSALSVERICDELDPTGRLLELVQNKALKMESDIR